MVKIQIRKLKKCRKLFIKYEGLLSNEMRKFTDEVPATEAELKEEWKALKPYTTLYCIRIIHDGKEVGYVRIGIRPETKHVRIATAYVLEPYRGIGLVGETLKQMMLSKELAGITSGSASVNIANKKVLRTAEKLGAKVLPPVWAEVEREIKPEEIEALKKGLL